MSRKTNTAYTIPRVQAAAIDVGTLPLYSWGRYHRESSTSLLAAIFCSSSSLRNCETAHRKQSSPLIVSNSFERSTISGVGSTVTPETTLRLRDVGCFRSLSPTAAFEALEVLRRGVGCAGDAAAIMLDTSRRLRLVKNHLFNCCSSLCADLNERPAYARARATITSAPYLRVR